jgi:hypothetical protein
MSKVVVGLEIGTFGKVPKILAPSNTMYLYSADPPNRVERRCLVEATMAYVRLQSASLVAVPDHFRKIFSQMLRH